MTSPSSLLRRETEKYDRARGRLFYGVGSRSSLIPVKREPEELPPVRTMKREPEAEAGPKRRAGGVVGSEDFLLLAETDAILPAMLAHSAGKEEAER
ncbi:hypothetical protein D1007_23811 [Hordeum vulgare]|nr:hypothetical protein D1007_23811 [Hordeum vulgare]